MGLESYCGESAVNTRYSRILTLVIGVLVAVSSPLKSAIGVELKADTPWVVAKDEPEPMRRVVEDVARDWYKALGSVRRQIHPAHDAMFYGLGFHHYWSAYQTEWATDTVFDSARSLAAIYPPMVRGAIATFRSDNVMRFLGHRLRIDHPGEIVSDYLVRPEGVRIKHRAQGNSIKVYDKGGSIPAY